MSDFHCNIIHVLWHSYKLEKHKESFWSGPTYNIKLRRINFIRYLRGKYYMQDLILALVDNSANNVEWILLEMLNQLEVLKKAIDEIDRVVGKERWVQKSDIPKLNYVKACAKEGYRLHPVAPFNLHHVSMQDMTVLVYIIPKGSHVLLCQYGLGHNIFMLMKLLKRKQW